MLKKYTPLVTDCQRSPGSNIEKLDKANDKYCILNKQFYDKTLFILYKEGENDT